MSNTTFSNIIASLPSLTANERKEIIKWCKAVPSASDEEAWVTVKTPLTPVDPDDWLAFAIGDFLISRGLVKRRYAYRELLAATVSLPNYVLNSDHLRKFLISKTGKLSVQETQQLGHVVVGALVAHLERIPGIEQQGMSARLLMNNIGKIPQALDGELPGYLANGMLRMVLPRK
jgi:hypothetical protein